MLNGNSRMEWPLETHRLPLARGCEVRAVRAGTLDVFRSRLVWSGSTPVGLGITGAWRIRMERLATLFGCSIGGADLERGHCYGE